MGLIVRPPNLTVLFFVWWFYAAGTGVKLLLVRDGGDVTAFDACPLHDPLIVCRDHLFEVGIGQQLRRNVGTNCTDFRSHLHPRPQRQTQIFTSPDSADMSKHTKLLQMNHYSP